MSHLALTRLDDGAVVVDGPLSEEATSASPEPVLARTLEPGRYRLESGQRPCEGNCRSLDPPADR